MTSPETRHFVTFTFAAWYFCHECICRSDSLFWSDVKGINQSLVQFVFLTLFSACPYKPKAKRLMLAFQN